MRTRLIVAGLILAALATAATPVAAGTEFLSYEGRDAIQVGQGGERKVVDGIDFWLDGSPPHRFQILGSITDERWRSGLIGVIAMSALEHDIAKRTKAVGGDAVILSDSHDNIEGYSSSALGNSTSITHAYGTHASRYVVVKYLPDEPVVSRASPVPQVVASVDSASNANDAGRQKDSLVALEQMGGILVVPVTINNAIQLKFIVDSGSSDVSIPADVFSTLVRTGTIDAGDYIGSASDTLADGSIVPSARFTIRKLKIGDREVANVQGSIANAKGPLLLGQSFLSHFKSWSIDNGRQVLILGEDQ